MRKPGVYAITCTVTGKQYVGSSNNMQQRWSYHRSALRHGKSSSSYLQNAWNKHGEETFTFTVLEVVENLDLLVSREQYHIDLLKPAFNARLVAHSNQGLRPRPESVEKMRASLTGIKRTEDTCERLRQVRLGKKFSPEWCENIRKGKAETSPSTRAKQSAAKKGKAPSRAALDASAAVNRGKHRSPEVIERIAASRKAKWAQQKAEGYTSQRDAQTGRFSTEKIEQSQPATLWDGYDWEEKEADNGRNSPH